MRGQSPRTHRIKVRDENGRVIGEKEVASYRGLLEMVHREHLREIRTELLQAPSKDNGDTAIVRAIVRTSRGTFYGIGDANPRNVNPKMAPHCIRLAETRAEARAMRKAVNIGIVSLEELEGDGDGGIVERHHDQQGERHHEHGYDDDSPETGERLTPFDHHRGHRHPNGPPGGHGNGMGSMNGGTNGSGNGSSNGQAGNAHPARASEQQRRFLYRLLGQLGKSGEMARAFIHEALGVESLDQAPKHAVSALIDSLKAELDGGGNGHGQHHGQHHGQGPSNGNGNGGTAYRDNGTHG